MRRVMCIFLFIWISACANQKSSQVTRYDSGSIAPVESDNFILLRQHTFDQPELGTTFRYMDKKYADDLIDIYLYPILSFDWSEIKVALNAEMDRVLDDIDYLVKNGKYDGSELLDRSDFTFTKAGSKYYGMRAKLTLEREGSELLSYVYLFIEEDKYVKFRVSFDANLSPDWSGDALVKELLPQFNVPAESQYMRQLRADQKKRYDESVKRQVLNLIKGIPNN